MLLNRPEVDDGVDAFGCDAECERELDVSVAVEIDEGVDSIGGRFADAKFDTVAVSDRDDATRSQPFVVRFAREADDGCADTTASWTVSAPTPPAAADTTTVSPAPSPTDRTAAHAVAPTTNNEPATSQGTDGGAR